MGEGEPPVEGDGLAECRIGAGLHPQHPARVPRCRHRGSRARRQREAHEVAGSATQRGGAWGGPQPPGSSIAGRPDGLRPDLRHGRRLPELATPHRAKGPDRRAGRPGGVDRPRHRCAARAERPGTAVPEPSRSASSGSATRRTSPWGPVQLTTAATVRRRPDASGPAARRASRPQPALRRCRPEGAGAAQPGDRGGGGRGHPVPVQVPPGRVVADQARAVGRVEPAPERGGQRAQRVERGSPVAAVADGGGDGVADEGAQTVGVGRGAAGCVLGQGSRRRPVGGLGRVDGPPAADRGARRRTGCGRAGPGSGRGRPW